MINRSTEITNAYVASTLDADLSLRGYLAFLSARLSKKELYKGTLNDWTSRLCTAVIRAGRPLKDFGTADNFVGDRKTFHYATVIGERQDSAVLLHSLSAIQDQESAPEYLELFSFRMPEAAAQQQPSIVGSTPSTPQQEEYSLLAEARSRLEAGLREEVPPPVEIGGVHCGRLLQKVQKLLIKNHAQLEDADYVAIAATFSTLVIPATSPTLYRSYLPDNSAWRSIRNCLTVRELPQLHEDESTMAADLVGLVSEMVELKRTEAFWYPSAPGGPVNDMHMTMLRRIFDSLCEESPEDKNPTTWIARIVAPLLGLTFDDQIAVHYDIPTSTSTARPGIVFTSGDHVLLVGEIITPNAKRAKLGEKMARLIKRGTEALKETVTTYDFNGKNPSMFILRVDGLQASVYELNLAKRMFYLHNVGNIFIPTTLNSDSVDCIAVAVFRFAALLRRLHRLKEAATRGSTVEVNMSTSGLRVSASSST
ncbi:hypothetical protein HDU86_007477 [Geranomyces michiganensis]|nr:hypothetical protein HDU86_007477 [Geranomyces michiganensis]